MKIIKIFILFFNYYFNRFIYRYHNVRNDVKSKYLNFKYKSISNYKIPKFFLDSSYTVRIRVFNKKDYITLLDYFNKRINK